MCCHERQNALNRLSPQFASTFKVEHEARVVHGAITKRRSGHARVRAEAINLAKKVRVCWCDV